MNSNLRSLIAALVCAVCATPSLIWGIASNYNVGAQVVGVAMYAIGSGLLVHTQAFARFWKKRQYRLSIKIGYGVRLATCVVFPLGMAVDLFPGLLSLGAMNVNVMGGSGISGSGSPFVAILMATLIQGMLLHTILWLFIGFVSLFVSSDPRERDAIGHGFQVVMPPVRSPVAVIPKE